MPKYRIRFPARCPRFHRAGAGSRWAYCPLPIGHAGDHAWPLPKQVHAARRLRRWQKMLDWIMERAKAESAEMEQYIS